jgi:hypothetical protein
MIRDTGILSFIPPTSLSSDPVATQAFVSIAESVIVVNSTKYVEFYNLNCQHAREWAVKLDNGTTCFCRHKKLAN